MTTKPKRPVGRPATAKNTSAVIAVRVPLEFANAFESWRKQQPGDPPISTAIRDLIERGLQAEGVAVAPPGLPYQDLTIDGRNATMVQVGRIDVTVFADGEVRTAIRGKKR
jgi:hypothetical protein